MVENNKYAEKYINKIYKNNKQYYTDERGTGMLKILNQVHNSSAYVAEILQNAIDSGATEISYYINNSNKLIVEHNGKKFTKSDVKNISQAGTSKKLADDIGFMGIGFKSVFERYQKVCISSAPWKFCFYCPRDEYNQIDQINKTLPEWNDNLAYPSNNMTCRFELSNPIIEDDIENKKEQIISDLNSVMGENKNLLVLLARQGIKKINWNNEHWILEQTEIDLDYEDVIMSKITAYNTETSKNEVDKKTWIHFSKNYVITEEAKKVFYKHRQKVDKKLSEKLDERKVEAFIKLNENGCPVIPDKGRTYAVLPMDAKLPIGLNIQADWLVEASRDKPLNYNAWHKLILMQIPVIIAAFLKWTTTLKINDYDDLYYFNSLPNFKKEDNELSKWINTEEFKNKLKIKLEDLRFLPSRVDENKYIYISPKETMFLKNTYENLNDINYKPWLLFNENQLFKKNFPKKFIKTLDNINLINYFDRNKLTNLWNKYSIKNWIEKIDIDNHKALSTIYSITYRLFSANENDLNKLKTEFEFIPLENGNWSNMKDLRKISSEWFNFIKKNGKLEKEIKINVFSEYKLINLKLLNYLNSNKTDGKNYKFLRIINKLSLKEIFKKWWNKQDRKVTENKKNIILNLTIKARRTNRQKLIKKVLCKYKGSEEILLLNTDKTLLSKPYVDEDRSKIYKNVPIIIDEYLYQDFDANKHDWKNFFDKLKPNPKGNFKLKYSINKYEYKEAKKKYKKLTSSNSNFPGHRKSPAIKNLKINENTVEINIKNNEYVFLNAELPDVWPSKDELNYNKAILLTKWLMNSINKIFHYNKVRIYYIPHGKGKIYYFNVNEVKTKWIKQLNNQAWIPAKKNRGVFMPSKILSKYDNTRPDAPVADIDEVLARKLKKAGIEFGSDISEVPLFERIKKYGDQLNIDQLYKDMEKLIIKAKKNNKFDKELKKFIRETFKIPIDKRRKISYVRIVNINNNLLDDYFKNYNKISEDNKFKKLLNLINNYLPFSETYTFEQILLYLKCIWKNEPDPVKMKDKLIFAYRELKEYIKKDKENKKTWKNELENAKVYLKSNEWILIKNNNIYYDDLKFSDLNKKISVIEDEFLGRNKNEKINTAKTHNISRVTNNFKVKIEPTGQKRSMNLWNKNLNLVKNLVEEYFNIIVNELTIIKYNQIKVIIKNKKNNEVIFKDKNKKTVSSKNKIYINNENINNISRHLAAELLDFWNLKNDAHFANDLAFLINNLDRETEYYINNVNEIRKELELNIVKLSNKSEPEEVNKENNLENDKKINDKKIKDKKTKEKQNKTETKKNKKSSNEINYNQDDDHDKVSGEKLKSSKNNKDINENKKMTSSNKTSNNNSEKNNTKYNSRRRDEHLNKLSKELKKNLDAEITPKLNENNYEWVEKKNDLLKSDKKYRRKVLEYEKETGRFPVEKSETQPGYDIISYKSSDHKNICRYIEVKGISTKWKDDLEVVLSRRQFFDAVKIVNSDYNAEYWLYVVEKADEEYNVIPLLNPSSKVKKFVLKANHWRILSEMNEEK